MSIRQRSLPEGWYPASARELEARLGAWDRVDGAARPGGASACIAPHAGWYYSGRIAWAAWGAAADADAVVIVGGHLAAGSKFRYYPEDGFETPSRVVAADAELVREVAGAVKAVPDTSADNTVEVHLPMAAYRFEGVPVACFRAPNDAGAKDLGLAIAEYAQRSSKRVFVLGSTDLTHYGKSYGFEPAGSGRTGFAWARKSDTAIEAAFLGFDTEAALRLAGDEGSACSVGAAIAAMAYAGSVGASSSRLLMRGSSDEITPGADSSVGYCSISYSR
ncbi:MAG: AmmeMemoRadiSam system protein B [Spirochaetes bacterium]|nr:AmmeMemoRadiSam system protein B [Spirochaetota bacterium]MBU1080553.1 AmmeMemoRadiSam system protein B [Spirochaetota bacterium]